MKDFSRRAGWFSVTQVGGGTSGPLVQALCALGCHVGESTTDTAIVVTDDYRNPTLQVIDRQSRATGRSWIPVKLLGTIPWIGPLFEPEGPCLVCLEQRLRAARPVEMYLAEHCQRLVTGLAVAIGPIVEIGAWLAAIELARWSLAGDETRLRGHLLTLDTLALESTLHQVTRRPQCEVCGDRMRFTPNREPVPIDLVSCRKNRAPSARHRGALPEHIIKRYGHLISPITGVVSGVAQRSVKGCDFAFSHSARHGFPMPFKDISALRMNLRGRSGGKGTSEDESMASAIGEALERYSGVFRGEDEIYIRASYSQLGKQAIAPNECLLFSPSQYQYRQAWNEAQGPSRFHVVPNPFHEDIQIDWTPVWSLTNGVFRYVPSSYCYYGHPDLVRFGFCGADSNGCAAGSTIVEAVVQGFLELVERDSVALWWYNRIRRPRVNAEAFEVGDYYRTLNKVYHGLYRSLWIIDITTDVQIPTFAAISARRDGPPQDIMIGYGAHLDANVAILRALTELNQFLPIVRGPKGGSQAGYGTDDLDTLRWFSESTIDNQRYLMPLDSVRARTSTDYPSALGGDLLDDAKWCIAAAQRLGFEVLCLDQTRPDIGMPTCRIIVPGFRHFWRRLGPGRLYDVPVKLGWLTAPRQESEMNPISMFF